MAEIIVSNITELQRAGRDAKAGDVVRVKPGNYGIDVNSSDGAYVLNIVGDPKANANARITFKAFDPNNKPVINLRNYVGIQVLGSYVDIDGFKIVGNNKDFLEPAQGGLGLAEARNRVKNNPNDPTVTGAGVLIGSFYENKFPNSVTVKNCTVQDCPGGGISTLRADNVTVENNTVFNNAFYNPVQPSGISFYQSGNSASNNGTMTVRNNKVYGNQNKIPNKDGKFTDGNGIIIDDNAKTQPQTNKTVTGATITLDKVPYTGNTIIQGNEVYNNGARGIASYISSNVEISKNRVYSNFTTKGLSNQTEGGAADISATINDNPNDPDSRNPLNTSKNIVIYSNDLGYSAGKVGMKIGEGVSVSYISVGVSGSPNPDTIDISTNFSSLKNGLKFSESNIFGGSGNDVLTGSNTTDLNKLFGEAGDDSLYGTGTTKGNVLWGGSGNDNIYAGELYTPNPILGYNSMKGETGNDFINCDAAKVVKDYIFYDNGDGQDQVYNFSLGNDQIHFKGINNINVKKNGSNTEFRDVATGSLLMTTVGTTGFVASTAINTDLGDFNAKYNLFGSNFTFS